MSHHTVPLTKIIERIPVRKIFPDEPGQTTINSVEDDSRKVTPGCVFVAVKGTRTDGAAFIDAAVSAGAAAVICSRVPDEPAPGVIWIETADTAAALGLAASAFYDYPSEKLTLIGVTGTNGKTTVATLLYETARLHGHKAGLLSTVVNRIDTEAVASTHTTPGPIELNALLARMVEAGCDFAAMEVSSHAAAQQRIAGLNFAGGIFTNLTRDHLDYHKTFDAYLRAKKSFFDALGPRAWALVNIDDRNGRVMVQNTKAAVHTYSVRGEASFEGRIIENRLDGMVLALDGKEVETVFTGRFNAQNLTAVYGAGVLLGLSRDDMRLTVSSLVPVAGRFQCFRAGGVTAVVDYAHTPDALANVLATIRDTMSGSTTSGKVITVFGAGGDRDHGKRPLMGAEAASRSDVVIVTSDNPRSEDPSAIIADILAGIPDNNSACRVITNPDREGAISTAVALASAGDVILIAGKGHEDYQITGNKKIHFDDRQVVCRLMGIHFPDNPHN